MQYARTHDAVHKWQDGVVRTRATWRPLHASIASIASAVRENSEIRNKQRRNPQTREHAGYRPHTRRPDARAAHGGVDLVVFGVCPDLKYWYIGCMPGYNLHIMNMYARKY